MRKPILILLLLPFSCLAAVNWTNYPNTNVPAWNDTFLIGNLGLKTNLQVTSSNLEVFFGGIYGTNVLPVGYIATNQNATLTGSLLIGDGARGVKNTAVGAVPIDGDGTATTISQIRALFPGDVVTNPYTATTFTMTHLSGRGSAPTVVTNAGAGGATGVVSVDANATDAAGTITLTTGSSTTGGADIFTLTFNTAYVTAPHVVVWPANVGAAGLNTGYRTYLTTTTTTFKLTMFTAVALASTTTYAWNYIVVQ